MIRNDRMNVTLFLFVLFFLTCFAGHNAFAGLPANCQLVKTECVDAGGTRVVEGVPVTLDCWKKKTTLQCDEWDQQSTTCEDMDACKIIHREKKTDHREDLTLDCLKTTTKHLCVDERETRVCEKGDYQQGIAPGAQAKNEHFARASAFMGVMAAQQRDMDKKKDGLQTISLFEGRVARCRSPIGIPLVRQCCSDKVTNHGFAFNQCDDQEKKLAAAKRAKRVHQAGHRYCSNWFHYIIGKVCLEHRERYCVFPSLLTRLIQEQGRAQINRLAVNESAEHNAVTEPFNWQATDITPHWHRQTINHVTVAAFTREAVNATSVPIGVMVHRFLVVNNDNTATLEGLTLSLQCHEGFCDGQLVSRGFSRAIHFDPTCHTPTKKSWGLGQTLVTQSTCLSVGKTPNGWPTVHWRNGHPSLFRFDVKSVIPKTLGQSSFHWSLGDGLGVDGAGQCDADHCQYQLSVTDHGKKTGGDFSFPLACQSSTAYQRTLGDLTFIPPCAEKGIPFAVCTLGDQCGALPENPADVLEQTSHGWQFFSIASSSDWQVLTGTVFVRGQCNKNRCAWQVKSLGPTGVSGTRQQAIRWNLHQAIIKANGDIKLGFSEKPIRTPLGVAIYPYYYGNDAVSKTIQFQLQLPGASKQVFTIPREILQSKPVILTTEPKISLWGACALSTGECHFQLTTHLTVKAMPWGDEHVPLCEGFSKEQLLLINWNQIDFSEFEKAVGARLQPSDLSLGQKQVMQQSISPAVSSINDAIDQGKAVNVNAPNAQDTALTVTPLEGYGPFLVRAIFSSNWPQWFFDRGDLNTDPVNHVVVDWGDGSIDTLTKTTLLKGVPVFKGTHTYQTPPQHNVTESIQATFFAKSGPHVETAVVSNVYDTPDTDVSSPGAGGHQQAESRSLNQLPGAGTYDAQSIPGVPKGEE